MTRVYRCPHGHQWPVPAGTDVTLTAACPECGSPPSGDWDPEEEAFTVWSGRAAGEASDSASGGDASAAGPGNVPVIPDYEILDELGRGGMGVVYKARQISLNRVVALKMILAGDHASPAALLRFRREAEAAAALHHPNIVQIYEVGEQDGRPYFSLEFVGGGSLAQYLRGSPVPARQAARLVEILARAMHFAHQRGIVHRDLKPANILLSWEQAPPLELDEDEMPPEPMPPSLDDCIPKITDFGLARRLEEDTGHTKTGAIIGTPSYIAPEQAVGRGNRAGPAADVYALGAILYELLTGRPPFRGETPLDTMMQAIAEEPVPPARLHSKVPRDLETICLKCLQKEPRKRYSSAEALADDLAAFLRGEPIKARPVGWVERFLKWAWRRPAAAALVILLHLAAAGMLVGILLYTRHESQRAFEAQQQREEAERQKLEALRQQRIARQHEEEAKRQERIAREQLEHSRRSLYALQLAKAAGLWLRDPAEGLELLRDQDRCPPELRDFTWGFLHRLCARERRILIGHRDSVSSVAVNPKRRVLASASWDGTVFLWGLSRGEPLGELRGHTDMVLAVAFAPDGTTLASAGEDGTIRLWDVGKRQQSAVLQDGQKQVRAVAFAPDGKTLASGGSDGRVRLWDIGERKLRAVWQGHNDAIGAVAFNPEGSLLVSASLDCTLRLWKVAQGTEWAKFHQHHDGVTSVAFSPDGRSIVSGSLDRSVRLWDVHQRRPREECTGHLSFVYAVAFSPDGKTVASAGADRTIRLWQPLTGEERSVLRGHVAPVLTLAFTPDGRNLISGSTETERPGNLRVWDVSTQQESLTIPAATTPGATLIFAPDSMTLAIAEEKRRVRFVKLPDGTAAGTLPQEPLAANALAFDPKSRILAVAQEHGRLSLWSLGNFADRQLIRTVGGGEAVRAVTFASDGLTLASAGNDQTIRLWDMATGREVLKLTGHEGSVVALAFSPTAAILASASDDEKIRLWDVDAGRERALLEGHGGAVTAIAFTRDGSRLVSVSDDETLRIWDVATGKACAILHGHRKRLKALAISPDGKTLATGGDDWTIKLWDAQTGQERATLRGHRGSVHALTFAPNGRWLASGSADGTVKIWAAD
ncbi:MAG: protein kinase [Gemmataceae bacterium]|nr:protein kinase [Gemmataceae bacterium]MDW8266833.1 protein kinase [Gemmataceae bacterium]